MLSFRLLNPTAAKLMEVIRAVRTLVEIDAGTEIVGDAIAAAKYAAAAGTGFVPFTGPLPETGEGKTPAVCVAWYTRLNGVKVVRVFGKVTSYKNGVASIPCNIRSEYQKQLLANGGFPVLVAERLAIAFGLMMASAADVPECKAVVENPGDLVAWQNAIDVFGFNSTTAADLRKCIGA